MQYIHLKDGTHISISDILHDLDREWQYGGVLVYTVVNDWTGK